LDNTYAAGVMFDAFAHGVDVSMQALTKYVGGHSDLLLGSVSARDKAAFERLGPIYQQLGLAVSPDDCSLALRGLQTLAVRLELLERNTLEIAKWLAAHPLVAQVLHPALPSCPGHDIWARDFSGSTSVFSFIFEDTIAADQVVAFINQLKIFKIGMSWGGVNSLAVVYPDLHRPNKDYGGRIVRLNIGLETVEDLTSDLAQAMAKIS
jgi:cystathionine beta-lyase